MPHELMLQFGCLGAITANGTSYLAPGNGSTQSNELKIRVPRPGSSGTSTYGGASRPVQPTAPISYTVRVNGVDTVITCTLDNATSGQDITHAVPIAQGDAISIKLVSNNAADASADVTASLMLT
jgi:hypothetical protein